MPASYAHLCYGQMVYRKFPAGLESRSAVTPRLFWWGCMARICFSFTGLSDQQ